MSGHDQVTSRTRMGNTPFQRRGHDLLVEHGFVFHHRNGKRANIYLHPDGRRLSVTSTPANESVALTYLKQNMRSPRLGLKTGQSPSQTRGISMATTEATKTAPLVAMADPFLLRPATTKIERRARISALAGWVKRVLERHGPLPSALLAEAAGELGFSVSMVTRARSDAGAIAWREGGARSAWILGLPHQVPEGANVYNQHHESPNGVESVREEKPPVEPPLVEAHVPDGAPDPAPLGAPTPVYGKLEVKDSEVAAAAQMLLDSLGITGFDPKVKGALQAALDCARQAVTDASATARAIECALELMA